MGLRERLKESRCVYHIRQDMAEESVLDELCRKILSRLLPTMQFPEVAAGLIEIDGRNSLPTIIARISRTSCKRESVWVGKPSAS